MNILQELRHDARNMSFELATHGCQGFPRHPALHGSPAPCILCVHGMRQTHLSSLYLPVPFVHIGIIWVPGFSAAVQLDCRCCPWPGSPSTEMPAQPRRALRPSGVAAERTCCASLLMYTGLLALLLKHAASTACKGQQCPHDNNTSISTFEVMPGPRSCKLLTCQWHTALAQRPCSQT